MGAYWFRLGRYARGGMPRLVHLPRTRVQLPPPPVFVRAQRERRLPRRSPLLGRRQASLNAVAALELPVALKSDESERLGKPANQKWNSATFVFCKVRWSP